MKTFVIDILDSEIRYLDTLNPSIKQFKLNRIYYRYIMDKNYNESINWKISPIFVSNFRKWGSILLNNRKQYPIERK